MSVKMIRYLFDTKITPLSYQMTYEVLYYCFIVIGLLQVVSVDRECFQFDLRMF